MRTILFSFLCMAGFATTAQDLSTKDINVFKNGTYFVVKEGNLSANNGQFRLPVPASPLLATYWISTSDNKIKRVDIKQDTIKVHGAYNNFQDILGGNQGKRMRLTYTTGQHGETRTIKGSLDRYNRNSGLIRIKTADGTVFIFQHNITEMVLEENFSEKTERDSTALVATYHLEKNSKSVPVRLSYMHTGMNWMPSYNIRLISDTKLQLDMKAMVENYSENIKDANLTLTLGAANFKYGHQIDPMALYALSGSESTTRYTYDNYAIAGQMQQMYSNSYAYDEIALPPAPPGNFESFGTDGEKSNDLYTYKLGKVTLQKNSKSVFSIFSSSLTYEHVYEVSLMDHVNYESNKGIGSQDNQQNVVYHSLCITNGTQVPFTTGPVFVQDENGSPLAQDQVKYTPVSGEAKVQLAKATDIVVKNMEEEISSQDKAKKIGSYYYKKVRVQGTIQIENTQKKAVKMKIDKTIKGDITETSEKGEVKRTGKYSGANPTSTANWTIDVGAGQKKTVTYSYDVFVYEGY